MGTTRIGDCWSSIRGLLQAYSTKTIKEILGKAGLPVFKIEYSGTHKGPILDGADLLVRCMDDDARDRLVIGCVEEIVEFENAKNDNLSKYEQPKDTKLLRELEQVLSRVGYGISEKDVFPLKLQLDLETAFLPIGVSEAIAEALRRYRDGRYAGAITSVCGAVDKITERLFSEKSLGDHKGTSYQERVSRAFATLETDYCKPLLTKGVAVNEVKLVWENHKKAVSQTAYVLGAFRREYSDAHGDQNAPAEFVQKSLDCAVFILRSFSGVKGQN
jgi:hypothetical protein